MGLLDEALSFKAFSKIRASINPVFSAGAVASNFLRQTTVIPISLKEVSASKSSILLRLTLAYIP